MKGQLLKIVFLKDKAYLTIEKYLTFEQMNLPSVAIQKSFYSLAFWTIRVLNYDEEKHKLYVDVVSYHIGETEFSENQMSLENRLNLIENIVFKNISTDGLLKTLNGTKPINYSPPVQRVIESIDYPSSQLIVPPKPIVRKIKETFFIPLKDVRFKFGCVSFDKKFKGVNKSIELTILNEEIREEFDAVKNYFANALNTKKIEVSVLLEIIDNVVKPIRVESPEIAKINKALIENVKFEFVKATTKKKISVEINKSIFTMDEYFDTFSNEPLNANPFYQNDKELFEDLLTISKTKHYKHLRFLSSKHSHTTMKLRFVHKPFSFLFLIEGDKKYHIIWETLDTQEATYIWHIIKDVKTLKLALRKVEDIINVIKVQGKTAYINSADEPFRRIYHDYSELIDGFIKWKGELESVLI